MPLAVCLSCPKEFDVAPSLLDASIFRPDSVYFYLAHAPLFAVARHRLFELALKRAVANVRRRMHRQQLSKIHTDVGPTNFSYACVEYVIEKLSNGENVEFSLRTQWPSMQIAKPLQYKSTNRNWRTNAVLYPRGTS
jgi:hypothetical protein